jgi:hypothetical protein
MDNTPIIPGPNYNPNIPVNPNGTRNILIICVLVDVLLMGGLAYYFLATPSIKDDAGQVVLLETDSQVATLEDKVNELEKQLSTMQTQTMQQPEEEGPPTLETK